MCNNKYKNGAIPLITKPLLLHFLFFILYFSIPAKAEVGPEKQYFLVYDFKNDWLVYDGSYKSYVPYISEEHRNQPALSLMVDIESNRRYSLLLYTQKDSYLFINAAMFDRLKGGEWRVMNIDSLHKKFNRPQLLLTFYGSNGTEDKTVMIAHRKGSVVEKLITVEEESFLNLRLRSPSTISDFFLGTFIIILTAVSLLFVNNPRAFERFTSLQDLFNLDVKDETFVINRPLSRIYISFLLLLSLELAYLYYFAVTKGYNVFNATQLLSSEQSIFSNIWGYLKTSTIILSALLLKYIAIYILSQMYRLESAVNIHYFKSIQASLIFFTFLLLIISFIAIYKHDMAFLMKPLLIIPTVIFYILRTVLLYFAINKHLSTKNLYLISYLCIAELIPLVIGIRYAF